MTTTTRPHRCPRHGRHHAGCTPCRRWSAWEKRTRDSQPRRTDPNPTRRHINDLRRQGMTLAAIADRAGISSRQIYEISAGIPRYILTDTAAALLAVIPKPTSPYVDATGVRRRLQALAVLGWPPTEIASRLHVTFRRVYSIRNAPQVTPSLARRVRNLYNDLLASPGPSPTVAKHAAARGWASPVAWNNIDDPHEQPWQPTALPADDQPDDVLVARALHGNVCYRTLRPTERVAVYQRLVAAGVGAGAMQNRLRINAVTLRNLADLARSTGSVAA